MRIEKVLGILNEKLNSHNSEVMREFNNLKKSKINLSNDSFTHFKYLNNMSYNFFQSFSFHHEFDDKGFLSFGEFCGANIFLGIFINLKDEVDISLSIGDFFNYNGKGYKIEDAQLINAKKILIGQKASDGQYNACNAVIKFIKFSVTESELKAPYDRQFSHVFAPYSEFHMKHNQKKFEGFFGMVQKDPNFNVVKKFKGVENPLTDYWAQIVEKNNKFIDKKLS